MTYFPLRQTTCFFISLVAPCKPLLMLENQGKVFTRQMLLDRLWDDDAFVEDRIVDSHIKNIRKKLDVDYIETIRGVGYRIDKEH